MTVVTMEDEKGRTNPHIPVLLIAIVTSPGFSVLPLSRDERLGSAGAIQRSWAGLV